MGDDWDSYSKGVEDKEKEEKIDSIVNDNYEKGFTPGVNSPDPEENDVYFKASLKLSNMYQKDGEYSKAAKSLDDAYFAILGSQGDRAQWAKRSYGNEGIEERLNQIKSELKNTIESANESNENRDVVKELANLGKKIDEDINSYEKSSSDSYSKE